MQRICMAGATGLSGGTIAAAFAADPRFDLTACVARSSAGEQVHGAPCFATVAEALTEAEFDVLVDYTQADAVFAHTMQAIDAGRRVVIGTSGLTAADYAKIDDAARAARLGVVASGNFALTAALMTQFSLMAAEYLDWFEIIDYSRPKKTDAPTGTARELAERMGDIKKPAFEVDPATVKGEPGLRGGSVNGVQVHSIRMPSYSATVTSTFAAGNSRLTITHDADSHSADILVPGTLLAAQKVMGITGLLRGLDNLL